MWVGRLTAVIEEHNNIARNVDLIAAKLRLTSDEESARNQLIVLLNAVRHSLRMTTIGPVSVAVGAGMQFDYFDEIRKIIESATKDIFFVDNYLDAKFVTRYFGHISEGVSIRLLARDYLEKLIPAVDAYSKQHGTNVEIRTSKDFHDRHVIIDGANCYQSGASFKDGAEKKATTITEIVDAGAAIIEIYEKVWAAAEQCKCFIPSPTTTNGAQNMGRA